MANENVARKPRVLADLVSAMNEQARIAQETAASPKVQRMTGSPYEAPILSGFTATKGKNIGVFQHRFTFRHKANPAWSRQYDLTDLDLLLTHLEEAKAARIVLRQKKEGEKK